MTIENIDFDLITEVIKSKMEDIAIILMKHEEKDYCLAQVSPIEWRLLSYDKQDKTRIFVMVPHIMFYRLIINHEYLSIVNAYPEHFGTGDDREIVKAIKKYDKRLFARDYSDEEFLDYIRGETMAYVFEIIDSNIISDRILRLDLCRNINQDNVFQGGILHALKHFTLNGYATLSSFGKEFTVESWGEIYKNIILNFFSDDFKLEREKYYEAKSQLKDGHILRGVYYKEDNIPVSFLCSLRIDG